MSRKKEQKKHFLFFFHPSNGKIRQPGKPKVLPLFPLVLLLNVPCAGGLRGGRSEQPESKNAGGDAEQLQRSLPADIAIALFLQQHQVIGTDFDNLCEIQHILFLPLQRFHGIAAGVERHAVVSQAGNALPDKFGDRPLGIFGERMNAGTDGGHDDMDVVTVLAQHGAHREQDVFDIINIGFIELINQLVCGLAKKFKVNGFGPCAGRDADQCSYCDQELEKFAAMSVRLRKSLKNITGQLML